MGNIQVVDHFLNKITKYRNISTLELLTITSSVKNNTDQLNETVKLANGETIYQYNNGFEIFVDNNNFVYAPVYDCSLAEAEGYSLYEEEDLIGYVNLAYKYTDYL